MLLPVLALRQHFDEEGVLIAEEPLNFARVDLHRHARIVAPLWMAAPYRPDTKRCFAKWALEDSNPPAFSASRKWRATPLPALSQVRSGSGSHRSTAE
jgi:hypothetical protein